MRASGRERSLATRLPPNRATPMLCPLTRGLNKEQRHGDRTRSDGNVPPELLLKPGETLECIGDSITAQGGYLRFTEQVLATNYPALRPVKIVYAGVSGHKAESRG
jgi:hypothetical protein